MMQSAFPQHLFISPAFPVRNRNGLAKRAAAMLETLSEYFCVHLLAPGSASTPVPPNCVRWLPLPRLGVMRFASLFQVGHASPLDGFTPSRRHTKRVTSHFNILESFAMGRPVISTPAGARGLCVTNEAKSLLQETPDTFAQVCVALMTSWERCGDLAARGRDWVRKNASPEKLRLAIKLNVDTTF